MTDTETHRLREHERESVCVCLQRLIKLDAGLSLEMEMRDADSSHSLIYKGQGSADLYVLYQLRLSGGSEESSRGKASGYKPSLA